MGNQIYLDVRLNWVRRRRRGQREKEERESELGRIGMGQRKRRVHIE